ncbi:MAG: Rho-binding antiterminator [Nitrosomonas sp.]|nr:Rho-binding antiterminator [Nitrosomonas sp.]MDP1950101.1 Rho-binding antiterminator [Nitrosomonas sp.]
MSQDAISCELHDFIEVACMYGYQVRLELKDQQVFEGKARDITTSEKREYLIISNEQQQQQVELTQLVRMQVLTPNARFTEVNF